MKVIKPSFEILTPISEGGIKELQMIERIGRVCYKSEDKISPDGVSAKKFVKMLIDRGHEAMIEHSQLSVLFVCDRGVSHELVRHRLCSFAQESQRYVGYDKDKFGSEITVIKPLIEEGSKDWEEWKYAVEWCETVYKNLRGRGVAPQIARGILPNDCKTEIVVGATEDEWQHILDLRYHGKTGAPHPQIKELMGLAYPILTEQSEGRVR